MAEKQLTDQERAQQLRERAAIERAEADEMESDHDVSPGRSTMARQARELARNYDRAADRLDPEPKESNEEHG